MMKNYFANTRKVSAGLADKVTRYEWGKEVAPGITAIDTSGHTPGHTAFAVASGNARVLIQSDVTNIPELFLRNPDWHVAFDIDPPEGGRRRGASSTTWRAAEKALVVGLPFPVPVDRLRREGRQRLPADPGDVDPVAVIRRAARVAVAPAPLPECWREVIIIQEGRGPPRSTSTTDSRTRLW